MKNALALLLVAAMSPACQPSSDDATPVVGGSGGEGGQGGAAEAAPTLYVSFVSETGPGAGPALLRMFNDTEAQILSLTLPTGEAFAFYLIEAQAASDYALVASDDMFEDAILSLHTLDTCIRRPFSAINGPLSLEPGRAYAIHIALEDGYIADIVEEESPDPYVGMRALIDDPAKATKVGAETTLFLSTDIGELSFEDVYGSLPAPFLRVDAGELAVDQIRLVDLAGVEHTAEGPFSLSGAFGYTVYVGPEPVEGAAHEVALSP